MAVLAVALFGVLVILVIAGVVFLIVMYNGLVHRRNEIDNAWAQIDVQLKRRFDLIPNLVATVRGYAAHERQTFEAVVAARAGAINATGPAQRAQAEGALSGALKSLFAVAEAYPALKANQNFLGLQEELSATESRITYARQYYNDAVLTYNNSVQTVPTSLFAGSLGFNAREYFQTPGDERGPVHVRF